METINEVSRIFEDVFFPVLKAWWWVPLPFLLVQSAWKAWLHWRRLKNYKERDWILLEIKLPEEIRKPIRAMEDVFTSMYGVALEHSPSVKREEWIEGEDSKLYTTFSLEIVGIDGKAHFFIWLERNLRDTVESIFHAQYPNIEFRPVEDYTKRVPQDIPNEEWDLEAKDWVLSENSVYPLRTYKDFKAESEYKEEGLVDPMARIFEGFARLKKGEQVWLQFTVRDAGNDWRKEGEKIRDELARREKKEPAPQKPIILDALDILLFGIQEEKEEKPKDIMPPEMRLTPMEKETISQIEEKMVKQGYKVGVRIVYLARKDVMYKPHIGIPISFLSSLGTGDQYLKPYGPSMTKVKSVFKVFGLDKRKAFLKKRRVFRNYQLRTGPEFPRKGGISVLTPDELATLFHFPSRVVAPGPSMERIEHKRGGPPPTLPVEE